MLSEMAEEISLETTNTRDSLIQSRVKVVLKKQQLGSNARVTSISEELQEWPKNNNLKMEHFWGFDINMYWEYTKKFIQIFSQSSQ